MIRIAPVADVKAKFSGYVKESKQGPIVITKNGKPVALLLSVTDEAEIERLILAYSPKFQGFYTSLNNRSARVKASTMMIFGEI